MNEGASHGSWVGGVGQGYMHVCYPMGSEGVRVGGEGCGGRVRVSVVRIGYE